MVNSEKNISINSKKFDGKICKTWRAELIKRENSLLIFKGVFDREIKHSDLGVIRRGTISYEYYWTDRWFNIFKFYEPDGVFRNFYCNINLPPTFEDNVLEYIDLDIDVIVWNDFSTNILDMDEFEINAEKYDYSNELKKNADSALAIVLQNIEDRIFPFDSIEPPL